MDDGGGGIAIISALVAGSVALFAFGLDSLIELVSARTILWLYTGSRSESDVAERRAQRLVAVCFGVLALYVTVDAINTLAGGSHPETSWPGVAVAACGAWAHMAEPARGAGLPAVAVMLAAAAALSAAIGCALRGHRSAAGLLAATGGLGHVLATAPGAEAGMFASSCVVAIGGLLIGTGLPRAAARRTALATSLLPLIALPVALAAGPDATVSIIVLSFTAIGPAAMVAPGWFDPRLAAAATTLVFSRLLAGGFDELGRALAVLSQEGQGALLARWALMSAGVVGAWFATRQSIRRMTHM